MQAPPVKKQSDLLNQRVAGAEEPFWAEHSALGENTVESENTNKGA